MRGMWQHLERLGGGVGTRGPGESQLETDRRIARRRVARAQAAPAAGSSASARRGARSAAAPRRPRSRSPATRTSASRRSSTRSPAPSAASRTASSRRSTRRRAPSSYDGRRYLADRHGRLHPPAAPPARRGLRRDARGDARRRHGRSTSPTPRPGTSSSTRWCAAVDDVLGEIGAGRAPDRARAEQDRPRRRGRPPAAGEPLPGRAQVSAADRGGSRRAAARIAERFASRLRDGAAARSLRGGRAASPSSTRSARRSRSARTPPRACSCAPASRGRAAALRAVPSSTRRQRETA